MKLKRYLRLNDLTSTEMALELGISHATMSRYLRGVSLPPIRIARIICKKTTAMVSQNDLVDQYLEFNLGSKKNKSFRTWKNKSML